VAIKAEDEASRRDTSPLTKLWYCPWSSIRDAEQLVSSSSHIQSLDKADYKYNPK
jgi:hypothetical protein